MAYCFLCFESQPKHDLGNNCHFFQPSQASLNSLQCIFTLFVFLHLFVKFKHSIFHGHSIFLSMVKATFDCMKFNKVATFHCNWHPKRPNNRHPVIPILTWIWCLNPSFFLGGRSTKKHTSSPAGLKEWREDGLPQAFVLAFWNMLPTATSGGTPRRSRRFRRFRDRTHDSRTKAPL